MNYLMWQDVINLHGLSSPPVRAMLSNAVATMGRATILEVGSYKGASAVAMCYRNDVAEIHCIDNHSEFGDTRAELRDTLLRFGLPNTIHDADYFACRLGDLVGGTRFNVYFYDGPHDEEQHARELSIALPHLADEFLYMVDDYSWPRVKRGCQCGLAELGSKVRVTKMNIYESERTNDATGFWNGLMVARCRKT